MRWRSVRPLGLSWRQLLLVAYVSANIGATLGAVRLGPEVGQDWQVFSALRFDAIYISVANVPFVWSPPAAWLMMGVVQIGYWPWVIAHVAAVLSLRAAIPTALVLTSYAFWFDTAQGSTLTFSVIAGMLAMRGSRAGSLTYLATFVLIPRPLLMPLAIWILLRQPHTRRQILISRLFAGCSPSRVDVGSGIDAGRELRWPAARCANVPTAG